jgi:hypothetical protein
MELDKIKKILIERYALAPRGGASIIDIIVDAVRLSRLPDEDTQEQIEQIKQLPNIQEED